MELAPFARDPTVCAWLERRAWASPEGDPGGSRWVDLEPLDREPRLRWAVETGRDQALTLLAHPLGVVVGGARSVTAGLSRRAAGSATGHGALVLDPGTGALRFATPEHAGTEVLGVRGGALVTTWGDVALGPHLEAWDLARGERVAAARLEPGESPRVLAPAGLIVTRALASDAGSLDFALRPWPASAATPGPARALELVVGVVAGDRRPVQARVAGGRLWVVAQALDTDGPWQVACVDLTVAGATARGTPIASPPFSGRLRADAEGAWVEQARAFAVDAEGGPRLRPMSTVWGAQSFQGDTVLAPEAIVARAIVPPGGVWGIDRATRRRRVLFVLEGSVPLAGARGWCFVGTHRGEVGGVDRRDGRAWVHDLVADLRARGASPAEASRGAGQVAVAALAPAWGRRLHGLTRSGLAFCLEPGDRPAGA